MVMMKMGGLPRGKWADNGEYTLFFGEGSKRILRGGRRQEVFCLNSSADLCTVLGLNPDGGGGVCSSESEEGCSIGSGRECLYPAHCGIYRCSDSPSAIISEDVQSHGGLGAV